MLEPRELLALPGRARATRWTGGDATKETIGAVDWGRASESRKPAYLATPAEPLLAQLQDVRASPVSEKDWIISVVELLAFVVLAAERGKAWKGELCHR